jgi:hypothetical protein
MPVALAIEIDTAVPLRGRVRFADGREAPFVGWMALAVLVADAADGTEAPAAEPLVELP